MTLPKPEGDFPCCTSAAASGSDLASDAKSPLRSPSPRELFDLVESGVEEGDFPHFSAALDAYVAQACAVAATEARMTAFGEAAHLLAQHHHPASATLLTAHAATWIKGSTAATGTRTRRQPSECPVGTATAKLLVGVEDCTVRTYSVTAQVPAELLAADSEEQLLIDWLNNNEPLWHRQCTAPAVPVRSDPGTMGLAVVDATVEGSPDAPDWAIEELITATVDLLGPDWSLGHFARGSDTLACSHGGRTVNVSYEESEYDDALCLELNPFREDPDDTDFVRISSEATLAEAADAFAALLRRNLPDVPQSARPGQEYPRQDDRVLPLDR